MRTIILGLAAAGLLGACSDDSANAPKEEAPAASLKPGEYEITAKVDALRSTDNSTPATASKADGPPTVTRTCVAADGEIEPGAFAESDEQCTATDSYVRGGRLNMQLKCNRAGKGGVMAMADGKFTADSFTAQVLTSTYFSGPGDYELTRTVTGKRVGECPPAGDPATAQNKAS